MGGAVDGYISIDELFVKLVFEGVLAASGSFRVRFNDAIDSPAKGRQAGLNAGS